MTATEHEITVKHGGRNRENYAERLEVRCGRIWEATVYVCDGSPARVEIYSYCHTCGSEEPTRKDRATIRRLALKWAKQSR